MTSAPKLLVTLLVFTWSLAQATAQTVIRVDVDGQPLTGQILAHNSQQCWVVSGDGRLHGLNVAGVQNFRKLSSRLPVDNAITVRARLQREFGRGYAVVSSGRYVVVAPQSSARTHLKTFDDIARGFTAYFSKRNIPLENPRFPMVAIVFANQREFAEYAAKDGVRVTRGLAGYYLRTSNRVASFEATGRTARGRQPFRTGEASFFRGANVIEDQTVGFEGSISGNVHDTLVHEATHQMAFNTGLHSRVGNDPKWVIEGLATLFEPEAVRRNITAPSPSKRINRDRLQWYQERVRPNWSSSKLLSLVASDAMFQSDALDAYALAWAVTFYLNETRPREYAKYLRTLKNRDPLEQYSSKQRVIDFRSAFGRDLSRFEAGLTRFLDGL